MGNSQGQLKSSKFETALHMSIEQSLRSSSTTPHPLFSQLYLEKDIKLGLPDVLPVPSDNLEQEQRESMSPRTSTRQESLHQAGGPVPPPLAPRLLSPLPPVPGSISMVHGPLQGVVSSPRLPPSSLAPNYHPQRFVLPGQYPPPHIIRPVLCNVPPLLPQRPSDKPSSHYQGQMVSPRDQRSSVDPSKPTMLGGCQDVGFCKAGMDIRLSTICDRHIDVPDRFVLVGATSPYLPEDILVVAVDTRFLPSPGNAQALHLAGFRGNCVGCGKKGFRYFNEFAHHINLRVMSVAKKENHLRYYIIERQGKMTRGGSIPWQDLPMNSPRDPPPAESASPPDSPGTLSETLPPSEQSPDIKEEPDSQGTSRDPKQPPKKRHRFHSLEEDKLGESPAKKRMTSNSSMEFLPPPPDTKDCAFIPRDLAECCGTKVVILECCGALPLLHGHVSNASVSRLFCESSSVEPSPSRSSEDSSIQHEEVLNLPTRILVLMKYLLQLGLRLPYREGFDGALMKAGEDIEGSTGNKLTPVTTDQLPSLAKLCASASNGRGRVILSQISLAVGLSEALQYLTDRPPTDRCPEYTFVIHSSDQEHVKFCVVVSGLLQARALREATMSSADLHGECGTMTADVQLLTTHFARSNQQGFQLDNLIAEFSSGLDGKVFYPFNSAPCEKVDESVAARLRPIPCEGPHQKDSMLHSCQIQAAMKILSQVCTIADHDRKSLDLGRFTKVRLLIAVPPSDVLYEQTVGRLHSSKLLLDVGLDTSDSRDSCKQFVIKLDGSEASRSQYEEFIASARSMTQTLSILIRDQAHVNVRRSAHWDLSSEIRDVPNILCLHVSSLPYSLQTRNSTIPRENEIVMEEHQDRESSSPQSRYFGLRDYQETLRWTSQTPLLQCDETFELMAESLLKALLKEDPTEGTP